MSVWRSAWRFGAVSDGFQWTTEGAAAILPSRRKPLQTWEKPRFCRGKPRIGGMAEWTKAAVLKTAVAKVTGGSNPSPTATYHV